MTDRFIPQLLRMAKAYKPNTIVDTKIAPLVKVDKPKGKIADYGAMMLEVGSTIKGMYDEGMIIDGQPIIRDAYDVKEHYVGKRVSWTDIKTADDPIQPYNDAMRHLQSFMANGRQKAFADFCNNDSNFTNSVTLSGNDQWDSGHGDATPIKDIQAGIETAAENAGVMDDEITMFLSSKVFRVLSYSDTIISQVRYGRGFNGQVLSAEEIAAFFRIKNVVVCNQKYVDSAKGAAQTRADMFGKHCWIAATINPADRESTGFAMTCYYDKEMEIHVDPEKKTKCDVLYVGMNWDQYILDEKSCYMIEDAIS